MLACLSLISCGNAIKIVPFSDIPIPTPTQGSPHNSIASTFPANYTANIPQEIMAESIQLDAPVVVMGWSTQEAWGATVTDWDVPENEAGWHSTSAGPGNGSNIVISGHNNSMGGRVFANVEDLVVGNKITLQDSRGRSYHYEITERNIVRALMASAEAEAYLQQIMLPTPTEQLTLITCWPSWSNTHRLIIIAKPR